MMLVQNEKPCHDLQIYYIVPDYIPVFTLYYLPDFQQVISTDYSVFSV